jgi:hypothetical protein
MDINTLIDNVLITLLNNVSDDITKLNKAEIILLGLMTTITVITIIGINLLKDLFNKVKSIKTNKFELIMKPDDEVIP